MNSAGIFVLSFLALANLGLLILLWRRKAPAQADLAILQPAFDALSAETRRVEQAVRDDLARQREESGKAASALRTELEGRVNAGFDRLLARQSEGQRSGEEKLAALRDTLQTRLGEFSEASDSRLTRLRQEFNDGMAQTSAELRQAFGDFKNAAGTAMTEAGKTQAAQLAEFGARLERVNETLGLQLEKIRATVEAKLTDLQNKNEQKLEAMRQTVDEKLEGTLEKRLGQQFQLVSERLEQVHKGLGEMQVMANSVGDLKRVLTNVKTRGTWGEIQLGALLEQTLTAEQFSANVPVNPSSMERVEFAIRLPGRGDGAQAVWLPIDAKFPAEDYQRLAEAADRADAQGVIEAGKALELRLRGQAKSISEKYVAPPHTTDFALMFLPSEGLYAEVLRRPGLSESLQRDHRIVIAGPTTLTAILNSLQMGFRTLAIEQRSSEVWRILAAFKREFGKFGEALASVKKKLEQASTQIEQTETRTRAVAKHLKQVESIPDQEAAELLPETADFENPRLPEDEGELTLFPPVRP